MSACTTPGIRTPASALLCGESVRAVGRLLGHEKAATTLKYAHLSDATVREAFETLSPVLSGRRA